MNDAALAGHSGYMASVNTPQRPFGTPADSTRSTASMVDDIVARRRANQRSLRGVLLGSEVSFGLIGKLLCSAPLVLFLLAGLWTGVWFSAVGITCLIVFGGAWLAYLTNLGLPRR